ncbi:hypothetical protein [Undibacterium sp. TS12]|uniref:hypothetical protein n=1 Tax=Undibacterium sp. TS12 TaxID=2908202 RepID=UPI001F4C8FC5|nr:hypothetical protein [Undibacterium sp. TS12]MCH8622494.1 hypothetical protein [Undibacterium sp. TS12]
MNKQKRYLLVGILLLAWFGLVMLARSVLSPVVGAATVLQLDASNLSFIESMNVMSVASLATAGISFFFVVVIYLVWRSR